MIKEAKNTRENPAQPVVTETIIQQEDTIDLVELFWVLVNHWKIILLTMLITAMLAGVYYLVGNHLIRRTHPFLSQTMNP